MPSVRLDVSQTYVRLPFHEAPYSCDGRPKVHKWDLCVSSADKFDIRKVTYQMHPSFNPRHFVKEIPPFKTTQTSWGLISVDITVETRDGREHNLDPFLILEEPHSTRHEVEVSRKRKYPSEQFSGHFPSETFGVELEMTHDFRDPESIARCIREAGPEVQVGSDHSFSSWVVKHDSSIGFVSSQPSSAKAFEIVSPKLRNNFGRRGLQEMRDVVNVVASLEPRVNKTAGFHVHVNASNMTFEQIRNVALSFVKYEAVFDLMVPQSRRESKNGYCKSNTLEVWRELSGYAVGDLCIIETDGQQIRERLENTGTLRDLVALVSPLRYYKLNLQNLVQRGGKQTIEFRQHGATFSGPKVEAWVRLLLLFVEAAKERPSTKAFKDATPVKERFDRFFEWVVKDIELYEYFASRVEELHRAVEEPGRPSSVPHKSGTIF